MTLLQRSGDFWKIEYANGAYGYASAQYVKEISGSYGARVKTSGGNLNVRTGAGTGYSVKAALPNGKNIVVLSQSNGWQKFCTTAKAQGLSARLI